MLEPAMPLTGVSDDEYAPHDDYVLRPCALRRKCVSRRGGKRDWLMYTKTGAAWWRPLVCHAAINSASNASMASRRRFAIAHSAAPSSVVSQCR